MKKIVIVFLLLLYHTNSFSTPVRVVDIIDGDTFLGDVILKDEIEVISVKVRLRNVDTPELHGDCENEIKRAKYAKQRLSELLPIGSIIQISNITNDKYAGRIDANVYDFANRDVGLLLVKENVGRLYNGGKRKSWCN